MEACIKPRDHTADEALKDKGQEKSVCESIEDECHTMVSKQMHTLLMNGEVQHHSAALTKSMAIARTSQINQNNLNKTSTRPTLPIMMPPPLPLQKAMMVTQMKMIVLHFSVLMRMTKSVLVNTGQMSAGSHTQNSFLSHLLHHKVNNARINILGNGMAYFSSGTLNNGLNWRSLLQMTMPMNKLDNKKWLKQKQC